MAKNSHRDLKNAEVIGVEEALKAKRNYSGEKTSNDTAVVGLTLFEATELFPALSTALTV